MDFIVNLFKNGVTYVTMVNMILIISMTVFIVMPCVCVLKYIKYKTISKRGLIAIVSAVLLFLLVVAPNITTSHKAFGITQGKEISFKELKNNNIMYNNTNIKNALEAEYGNDIEYQKEDNHIYDVIYYSAELRPIKLYEFIGIKKEDIVNIEVTDIEQRTDKLVLSANNNLGYDTIEEVKVVGGVYYKFNGQALGWTQEIENNLGKTIKSIDITYDTHYPAMEGQNLMARYRIDKITYNE